MTTVTSPFELRRFQAELHKALVLTPEQLSDNLIPVTELDPQILEGFLCIADPHCTEEYNEALRDAVLSPDPDLTAYALADGAIDKPKDIRGMISLHTSIEDLDWEELKPEHLKTVPPMRAVELHVYVAALYHPDETPLDVVTEQMGVNLATALAQSVQQVLSHWQEKIDQGVGLQTIFNYHETLPSPNLFDYPHPPKKLGLHVEAMQNAYEEAFADFPDIGSHEMWVSTNNLVPADDEEDDDEDPTQSLKELLHGIKPEQ